MTLPSAEVNPTHLSTTPLGPLAPSERRRLGLSSSGDSALASDAGVGGSLAGKDGDRRHALVCSHLVAHRVLSRFRCVSTRLQIREGRRRARAPRPLHVARYYTLKQTLAKPKTANLRKKVLPFAVYPVPPADSQQTGYGRPAEAAVTRSKLYAPIRLSVCSRARAAVGLKRACAQQKKGAKSPPPPRIRHAVAPARARAGRG